MQKKLESELMSLAHEILKLKNKEDVKVLKQKAHELYEKLAVLSFIDKYVEESPLNKKSKEELTVDVFLDKPKEIVNAIEDEIHHQEAETLETIVETEAVKEIPNLEAETEVVRDIEDLFSKKEIPEENEVVAEATSLQSSLEQEFAATVSLDVTTDLFENAQRVSSKKSINDAIMQQKNIQIDLNDRIAFVKNLFENSQEDFNRVISQLNTLATEKEALSLLRMIKKEYNWNGKEVYEERLLMLIERKFN